MMNWYRTVELKEIFPSFLSLFWIAAILGLFFSIKERKWKIINLLIFGLSNLILFLIINNSPIYNTRFLPFFIMCYILIGAIGIGYLFNEIFSQSKVVHLAAIVLLLI
jgi:CDP-diglyceride synthetase